MQRFKVGIAPVIVGSGLTGELFARRGYEVLGLDISPDMVALADRRAHERLRFQTCDYESESMPGGFDIAVIYDALHHAENASAVVDNIFASLVEGGTLVTIEPGAGHSKTADSIAVMRKYGTTERDMPPSLQRALMMRAGFVDIRQYLRFSTLLLQDLSTPIGWLGQVRNDLWRTYRAATGMTCIMVATKSSRRR